MPFGGQKNGTADAPPQEFRAQNANLTIVPEAGDGSRYIERKRDDLVWRSLWRADAALKVEEYFRSSPSNPSLEDIMENLNLAPNAVDKDFLRACAVVADKFREQRDAVSSVMLFLFEKVARSGLQRSQETLGNVLYEDMVKGKSTLPSYPRTGIKLKQMNGFLLLTIENDAAYNALYDEFTPEARSGGRFHRALEVTIAKRKVPVIVSRGERNVPIEEDPLIIHEMQHWINEGLAGLSFMERGQGALFSLDRNARKVVLMEQKAQRKIKDEVLAYIREGRSREIERILLGSLYSDLFHGVLLKDNEHRKKQLSQIQMALSRFAPLIARFPRLNDILTYMLLPVPFGNIATRLDTIRTTFERTNGIAVLESQISKEELDRIYCLPRKFESSLSDIFTEIAKFDTQKRNASKFMYPSSSSNSKHEEYKTIHSESQGAVARAERAYSRIKTGFHGGFVPYIFNIEGFENMEHDESKVEVDSAKDALDVVQRISKEDIDTLYSSITMHTSDSHKQGNAKIVARNILQHVSEAIEKRLHIAPNVELHVRETGIQIKVSRFGKNNGGQFFVRYSISIPRVEQNEAPQKFGHVPLVGHGYPTIFFIRDFEEPPLPEEISDLNTLPYAYVKVYNDIKDIGNEISQMQRNLRTAQQYLHCSFEDARYFKQLQDEYSALLCEQAFLSEKLFRNNAHIPLLSFISSPDDLFSSDSLDIQDKFCDDLYAIFDSLDQKKLDEWINRPETNEEDWSREAEILDVLQKRFNSKYSSGTMQGIGLKEVYFDEGFCIVYVKFSTKDKAEVWRNSIVEIKLFATRKGGGSIAKSTDSK